ncbi:MAG: hypothetical protein ACRDLL_14370, partial [Solirubrobacterales bacterium]
MTARGRHLERVGQVGLAPDVGEVGQLGARGVGGPCRRGGRVRLLAGPERRELAEALQGNDPAAGERRLGGVRSRNGDRLRATATRRLGHRERPGHRSD